MSFTEVADLLGAWRLESAVEVFDDGERRDEFGPSPEGYLCYNPAGIVSATLGDSRRPPVSAGDPQSGTVDDYEQMARHFIAFFSQRADLAEGLSGRHVTATASAAEAR